MRKRCKVCGNIFDGMPDEDFCEDCLMEEELRDADEYGETDWDRLNIGVD